MDKTTCQNCGKETDELFQSEAGNFPKNCLDLNGEIKLGVCQCCFGNFQQRKEEVEKILTSSDKYRHRLIVGGPGAGKTFTFGKILNGLPESSNTLIITFINNLVEDLRKGLTRMLGYEPKVRTLHSFARSQFHSFFGQKYFPELSLLIEEDSNLLGRGYSRATFSHGFLNIQDDDPAIDFYLKRATYYEAAGHDDSVYQVYNAFRKDSRKISKFDQLIVDEYQDFSALEVALIDLLARNSRTVIAGDDDQALYQFRDASPRFIRSLYRGNDFENFFLTFCNRCTLSVVESTNYFITQAKDRGILCERIDEKNFECYWPEKFQESRDYPFLHHAKCSTRKGMALYIGQQILNLTEKLLKDRDPEEAEFLIIGPMSQPQYLNELERYLSENLDSKRYVMIRNSPQEQSIPIAKGHRYLKSDRNSNLGWRIVLYNDPLDSLAEIIKSSFEEGTSLLDLLPGEYVEKHMKKAEEYDEREEEENEETSSDETRIKVKLVTYLGAKGLSSSHVFVVGLRDGILPKNPNDMKEEEICQFIVALTRSRGSVHLVTSNDYEKEIGKLNYKPSIFLRMLLQEKIQTKAYRIVKGKLVEAK